MSTASTEALPSHPVISHENLLFDYPEADVILHSRDSYEFRVLKIFIVHSSPILGEKVLISPTPQPKPTSPTTPAESGVDSEHRDAENAFQFQAPVVQLPIDGAILFSLLTYIFPVPPVLPSTVEQVIELLSVAQMYKMDAVLTHIRNHISQQEPPFVREGTAFLIYSLSQKHSLRTEALQAAKCTLSFSSLTFQDLADERKLDMMPGRFLYELWKYHQRVRSNLLLDLNEFKTHNARTILEASICGDCEPPTGSSIPSWLETYISTIGTGRIPAFLDVTDFHMAIAEHSRTGSTAEQGLIRECEFCPDLPRECIRELWKALTDVVHGSMSKAESEFSSPSDETWSEHPIREAASPPKYSKMLKADVILQSSDHVNFHVHKSVLATSSPFFSDMFSLPQPPNDTARDELPVVHVSEDSIVLNSLISLLYPVTPEMPNSGDDSLALLAATAKYDMDTVRSSIRTVVSRRKLLSSTRAGLFRVYAVACRKNLVPEMAMAARLTLSHPLTFESIGDEFRSFEGCALRDLVDFRQRCVAKFVERLIDCHEGPSNIWASCPILPDSEGHLGAWERVE